MKAMKERSLSALNEKSARQVYIKPEIEVIKMELEQPILAASSGGGGKDYEDGGWY